MLRHMILTAGLILLPAMAFAEDLSGTWVRDGARSDVVPSQMYWITRGVEAGNTRGPDMAVTISLVQTAETLAITDPARPLRVLQLDGQAHTAPTDTGLTETTVTASADGDEIVVETTQPYAGMPGNVTLKAQETWRLGADGALTVVTVRDTPARRFTYTEVYRRQ